MEENSQSDSGAEKKGPPITWIPPELVLMIMQHVAQSVPRGFVQLVRCGMVCRQWRVLAKDPSLKLREVEAQTVWGTWGAVTVVAVDKKTPMKGSLEDYTMVAKIRNKKLPNKQYPLYGTSYSSPSMDPDMFEAAKAFWENVMHPAFPEATYDDILVLHGTLPDGWGHNHENGCMFAWGGPSGHGYGWVRGGNIVEKRFHVYICM